MILIVCHIMFAKFLAHTYTNTNSWHQIATQMKTALSTTGVTLHGGNYVTQSDQPYC